jgi:hypothetical protein
MDGATANCELRTHSIRRQQSFCLLQRHKPAILPQKTTPQPPIIIIHTPDVLVTTVAPCSLPQPPNQIPQLPPVEQLEEPVVDAALANPDATTSIHTTKIDSSAATDPPDALTYYGACTDGYPATAQCRTSYRTSGGCRARGCVYSCCCRRFQASFGYHSRFWLY